MAEDETGAAYEEETAAADDEETGAAQLLLAGAASEDAGSEPYAGGASLAPYAGGAAITEPTASAETARMEVVYCMIIVFESISLWLYYSLSECK